MRSGEVDQHRGDAESKHRGKEVQWLHKELQKVEREKARLEREREKYLEREARLERMRRAMGQCPTGKQEVLIQTSTGFFRFQGISEKFTRKLYEWEKQRGIGPEASTFALLDPAYIPLSPLGRNTTPAALNASATTSASVQSNILAYQQLVSLPRCRSEGSVAESSPAIGGLSQSRSSSLGLVDPKQTSCLGEQEVPSRASSEPQLRSDVRAAEDREEECSAAALLVEVVEETAPTLEHLPELPTQLPIYSYAPEEVTRLIDSSGSESEKAGKCSFQVNRTSSVRTQSSYELIEENITLINKLKMKEDICRELENEIEDLEEKIQDIAKTHKEELERLKTEETGIQETTQEQWEIFDDDATCSGGTLSAVHTDMVARLKLRVNELERCQEQLKQEEENLQAHSEQQAALAQNLVGKMKQLHEVSKAVGEQEEWGIADEGNSTELTRELMEASLTDFHSMELIQNLSTELLLLAEKLEVALADRNQEIRSLRHELQDRQKASQFIIKGINDATAVVCEPRDNLISTDKIYQPLPEVSIYCGEGKMKTFTKAMIPRQSSEELAELPFLLTNKVLELKQELSRLCIPQEPAITLSPSDLPRSGILQKTQSDEDVEVLAGDVAQIPVSTHSKEATSHGSSASSTIDVRQEPMCEGVTTAPAAPRLPRSPHGVPRRKSSDCVSTPPSERTRSPSVSSVDEWKGSSQSWHEAACHVAGPGGPESAAEDSDDTDSRSDDDSGSSAEKYRKERRVSDTRVPSAQSVAEASARESDRRPASRVRHAASDASRNPASNVFVQTTRKIFSPIGGETKGNVISYVVGLPTGGEADDAGGGPWPKSQPQAPERGTTSPSYPRRPPGVASKEGQPCASPLPPPGRRDKSKEAAPSIRLMIAKYDRKEANSGQSAEAGLPPGGRSPAWLSPTADRRDIFAAGGVRAQMEKYQDEVRRALLGYSSPEVATVQKSASAGIIRSLGVGPALKPPLHSIAKSSSVGAIKSVSRGESAGDPLLPPREEASVGGDDSASPISDSIERTLRLLRGRHVSPPTATQPHNFAHLRALRLRKAKEEFMARSAAVGGASKFPSPMATTPAATTPAATTPAATTPAATTAATTTPATTTPATTTPATTTPATTTPATTTPATTTPVAKTQAATTPAAKTPATEPKGSSAEDQGPAEELPTAGVTSRHSQISFGSESSYDDSTAILEGLTKSASSGMIDLCLQKYKRAPLAKLVEKDSGSNDCPLKGPSYKCAAMISETSAAPGSSKMGILSRFRKVKMRTKKMGAITALCRQSLLVNVRKEGGGLSDVDEREVQIGGQQKSKPNISYSVASCRSCPSSPVPSSKKSETSSFWIHNPKHIFKPQNDCEETFPNTDMLFPHKSQT